MKLSFLVSTSAEYLIENDGTCWSWSTIFLTKNAASWRDAPATWFLRNGFRRFKRTAARNWQLFSLADMVNLSVAGPSKQLLMIFLGWTLIIFVTFSTPQKLTFYMSSFSRCASCRDRFALTVPVPEVPAAAALSQV